jgi:hypothetical protein
MPEMRRVARGWNFDEAIDLLNIREPAGRERFRHELIRICALYRLEVVAEGQETPARKAATLKKAIRVARWSPPDGEPLRPMRDSIDTLRLNLASLPPALAMEVVREMQRGLTLDESLAALRTLYLRETRPGPKHSYASRNAVHRLEACACQWDRSLGGLDLKSRRRLKDFILATLRAARIRRPDPDNNPSKFNKLRVGYVPRDPALERHRAKRPRTSRAKKEAHLARFNKRLDDLLGANERK